MREKKKKDHDIINTDINGPKYVCWPEDIANEHILLALFVTENDHQIGWNYNYWLELQCNKHNVNFISHKNINPRFCRDQEHMHQNRKGQYIMASISNFRNESYFFDIC